MNKQQVLIIEDDRDTAVFFQTVLTFLGFSSEILLSAREALARLAALTPDLVLLDIRLGGEISGEDILYQVRSNPRFDKTRVVIITAYPRLAEPITELADLILLKPVDIEQLKGLLQRLGEDGFRSKHQLFRDPATGLFNQEFFLTRLDLAFERVKRRPEYLFALIVYEYEVDPGMEAELEAEGSLAVLREIGARFTAHIRPTDAAARLAGWQFVALYEDLNGPADLQTIIDRLSEVLTRPFAVGKKEVRLKLRLGSAAYDPVWETPAGMLHAARETCTVTAGD
jgi:PleD family two-component response regulator